MDDFWDEQDEIPLEVRGILVHPLSYYSGLLFLTFQEAGVVVGLVSIGLFPGGIGLADGPVSFRCGEPERAGQTGFLVTCASGLLGGISIAG